jgi:flagellar basal body P-ring formation protein FlgA
MIKRFVLSFALLGAMLGSSAPACAAGALLRAHVLVDGPVVTLGDLFDNVGDRANVQVLHAPPPGTHITVDTDWLTHVALLNNVAWKPRDLFDEAVIERTGLTIGRDQIIAAVQAALIERGAPTDAGIDLESRTQQMIVATDQSAKLSVRDLFFDPVANRFSATMAAGDSRLMVAGKLYPTIEVPEVTRAIPRGETVIAEDVSMVKVRQDQLRQATVTDIGAVVGMAAKVPLRAGQPISEGDLQRPLAVSRGALVTLVLNYNGMQLTAQGRAVDQGSLGDTVRVTNTHSNLTVEGVIDGTNRVRVSLSGPVAMAN